MFLLCLTVLLFIIVIEICCNRIFKNSMHFIATNMHFTFNALNVFVYSDVVMHFEVKWIYWLW